MQSWAHSSHQMSGLAITVPAGGKPQLVSQSPSSALSGSPRALSQLFTPQSIGQAQPPSDWTFHPLPSSKFRTSALPFQANLNAMSENTSSTDSLEPETDKGYFHHAKYRITTNIDIKKRDDIRNDIVEHVKGLNTDEFTEVIAIPTNEPGLKDGKKEYVLCYADHFNRTLGSAADGKFRSGESYDSSSDYCRAYVEWIGLIMQSPRNHLLSPSAKPKEYSCLGRKIAQQVVWDHQNGHITKLDIENAFSMNECSSLLSALQKKRGVTDKQCQKIIKTVIERFLTARPFIQPGLGQAFSAGKAEGERGRITTICVLIALFIWHVPMLSIPLSYFRRLRVMASQADKGAYLPHLWRTLIKGLLKEWTDLNIV
ncbi:unnamed protein product, partial [Rhizoctonia solani]